MKEDDTLNKADALFDSDNEEAGFKINKKYAADFQSRKQKEELRKVKFQGIDSDDESSSSSSEDEEAELLTTKLDVNIMRTINALRNRDTRIYDGKTRFFEEEQEEKDVETQVDDEGDPTPKEKKTKRKTYKDVVREQVLEQMKEEEEGQRDSGKRDDQGNIMSSKLVYNSQQAEIRQAFLDSTKENSSSDDDDDSDDEDLLIVKTKHINNADENDQGALQELQMEIEKLEKKKLQGDYVDPKGEVKDGEKFLLDFFKKRSWIENDESGSDSDVAPKALHDAEVNDGNDSVASLEHLDEADNFEAKYNFRFEEAAAGTQSGADFSLVSYARGQTMETLRRKDESRREKRTARKERKAAERRAKEEQLKRLKNAKRQEMEEKLIKIKEVLGEVDDSKSAVDEAAILKLLEGDFDPEKFQQLMEQTYGDDFYQKEDTEWKSDRDVRDALKQDEDGYLLVGDEDGEGGLYDEEPDDSTEHQGETDQETYNEEEEWAEEYNRDGEEEPEDDLTKKLREKMTDELYKLDYEDIVAGIPTRFKYRKVEPNSYGLSTEEILFARDSTLKQYVSLKKMAPYREEGEYFVNTKRRKKFREMLTQDLEEQLETEKSSKKNIPLENEESAETKKKKRRRLKKGKDSSEGSKSVGIENQPKRTSESNPPENKSKKKRKRKDKDKSDPVPDEASRKLTAKDDDKPSPGKNSESCEKFAKEGDSSPKKKKKRKKKSSEKLSVDGVSKSRLASYGL